MKKYLFVAVLAIASVMVYAQPRAIGGRLGGFEGVSYQHSFGDSNMLEVEAGLAFGFLDSWSKISGVKTHGSDHGYTIQAAATYDWIDPFGATFPWEHKGEWHWYLGAGGAAGYGNFDWNYGYGTAVDWGFIAGAGRAGVEYDFWFPLQLSLDWRPTLGLGLYDGGSKTRAGLYWEMSNISLGVRYKF